jgi:hypothetical protein
MKNHDGKGQEGTDSENDSIEQCEKAPSPIQKDILHHLAKGPMKSSELKASVGCAPSTFYKHLEELKESRSIIHDKIGRVMIYALPGQEAELYKSTEKRTDLERHVIKNAYLLLDELMSPDHYPGSGCSSAKDVYSFTYRHDMLIEAVKMLRPQYPTIPIRIGNFPDAEQKPYTLFYRYWLEVLQHLHAI